MIRLLKTPSNKIPYNYSSKATVNEEHWSTEKKRTLDPFNYETLQMFQWRILNWGSNQ